MVSAYRPASWQEALEIRRRVAVIPLAGGTDLMVRHRRRAGLPPDLPHPTLFIGHLPELCHITVGEEVLTVGAGVTYSALLAHPHVPAELKQAIARIGSPAVRNVATLAGNICNASPAGDTLPYLYCVDAQLVLTCLDAERRISISDFIQGPGRTSLRPDELLEAVVIPRLHFNRSSYRKVGPRRANALAKVSFLGLAAIQGDVIADVRIAFGAVAPTVIRSREVEQLLIGRPTPELDKRPDVSAHYGRLIRPIDDQRSTAHYRRTVALKLLDDFMGACLGHTAHI